MHLTPGSSDVTQPQCGRPQAFRWDLFLLSGLAGGQTGSKAWQRQTAFCLPSVRLLRHETACKSLPLLTPTPAEEMENEDINAEARQGVLIYLHLRMRTHTRPADGGFFIFHTLSTDQR